MLELAGYRCGKSGVGVDIRVYMAGWKYKKAIEAGKSVRAKTEGYSPRGNVKVFREIPSAQTLVLLARRSGLRKTRY